MPEHQPRDPSKEREGEGLGSSLVTADLCLTPCCFLGARNCHLQPSRAADEVSWGPSKARGIGGDSSLLESVLKNRRAEPFLLLVASFLASHRQAWDLLCSQLAPE